MTTTLRINEDLYRKAKAKAASEGITLTKFIEQGLELRIDSPPAKSQKPFKLRTYRTKEAFDLSPENIKALLHKLDNEQAVKIISGES